MRRAEASEPPFFIGYNPVLVGVHLFKKSIELGSRDDHARARKGRSQLVFVDFPIVIAIDFPKCLRQTVLRVVNERLKF